MVDFAIVFIWKLSVLKEMYMDARLTRPSSKFVLCQLKLNYNYISRIPFRLFPELLQKKHFA